MQLYELFLSVGEMCIHLYLFGRLDKLMNTQYETGQDLCAYVKHISLFYGAVLD